MRKVKGGGRKQRRKKKESLHALQIAVCALNQR
jgi:hypothetical protein